MRSADPGQASPARPGRYMHVAGAVHAALGQPLTHVFSVAAVHVFRLPPQLTQPLTHWRGPLQ